MSQEQHHGRPNYPPPLNEYEQSAQPHNPIHAMESAIRELRIHVDYQREAQERYAKECREREHKVANQASSALAELKIETRTAMDAQKEQFMTKLEEHKKILDRFMWGLIGLVGTIGMWLLKSSLKVSVLPG